MKKVILLALTFCLYTINAQEFQATEKYLLTNERSVGQEEESAAQIDLVAAEDELNILATLAIADLQLLESVHLSVLANPNLEGIAEILKVELEYLACCASVEASYFLVTDQRELIALPHIYNEYCGEFESDVRYIFPSQTHGREGTILRAEQCYSQEYLVKDIRVVQSYVWNDDDFDYEEALSAIEY